MKPKPKKKRRWLVILLSIVGLLLAFLAAIVITSHYISTPTTGAAIGPYVEHKSALLVVGVQKDTTSNTAFYGDTTDFVEKVNRAVTLAQDAEMETLYIRNEYGNNPLVLLLSLGRYRRGTVGVDFDGRLRVINRRLFSKSVADSFSDGAFEDYLLGREIDTLYIVGADAAACVHKTALGGVNRGYCVTILKDAVITINDATMVEMLRQYEKDGIEVMDLDGFAEMCKDKKPRGEGCGCTDQ